MKADFIEALDAIEKERGISKEVLIDASLIKLWIDFE